MKNGVSVIVCCYNSSRRLFETLSHLKDQKTNGISWETIVVDNASTDDTSECARSILSSAGNKDFTIITEPKAGLSNARKKGYDIAKYEYLLYCDDDNWLAENYIQLAYETMEANPKIGILGGLAKAVFESTEPVWFKMYEIDFAVGEQSLSNEALSRVDEVYGAGFVIRKAYLDKLYGSGFESILTDRTGTKLVSGGDTELCYLAGHFGFEVWYNRQLGIKHFMTSERLNWEYMEKLYSANGITNVYAQAYEYVKMYNRVPGQNLRLPFWLDTFIHKVKQILRFYPKVMWKMGTEGDADALRYIAMKTEAQEIWDIKDGYSKLYQKVYLYLNRNNKLK